MITPIREKELSALFFICLSSVIFSLSLGVIGRSCSVIMTLLEILCCFGSGFKKPNLLKAVSVVGI